MRPGATEILIILLILVVLFGAKKLPELARGMGRSLRIFKAETKGLMTEEDEDDRLKTPEQKAIEAQSAAEVQRLQQGSATGYEQSRPDTDR